VDYSNQGGLVSINCGLGIVCQIHIECLLRCRNVAFGDQVLGKVGRTYGNRYWIANLCTYESHQFQNRQIPLVLADFSKQCRKRHHSLICFLNRRRRENNGIQRFESQVSKKGSERESVRHPGFIGFL
jgi:hypothetical protein